jgi:putative SOS response-associated peptidase YedK
LRCFICAIFLLKSSDAELASEFGVDSHLHLPAEGQRYLPYSKAPVVTQHNHKNHLTWMNFSLVPAWSDTPRVKFATHNARIETVLTKPTLRKPFLKNHCVIPMSEFVESITEIGRPLAGNMVRFSAAEHKLFGSAGIYDEWIDKKTGEVLTSFAILTTTPPKFIAEQGHDRCPIFLKSDTYNEWLSLQADGEKTQSFLLESVRKLDFVATIDRPLKAGWEKRA